MGLFQQLHKKGFTLPELLVVMAILALLAAVSTPFIKGYIRDAENGRAKSALVQIAEGAKNFRTDYPNATVSGAVTSETRGTCGDNTIDYDGANEANVLVSCKYIRPIKWSRMKYSFNVGAGSCAADGCANSIAYMTGTDSAGEYTSSYCACVDEFGNIKDNKE